MSHMTVIAHSTQPEFEMLGCTDERLYIPSRMATAVSPKTGRIVLPRHVAVEEWWRFCCRRLPLEYDQALWVSGDRPLLDDDILDEAMGELHSLSTTHQVTLFPYSATEPFTRWAGQLPARVFGDAPDFISRFADKSVLHTRPGKKQTIRVPASVATPRGYACHTVEDLLWAHDELEKSGVRNTILKPCLGSAGDGIIVSPSYRDLERYAFPFRHVVLEESLAIDRNLAGCEMTVSAHYAGRQIAGQVTDQIMHGKAHAGNVAPSETSLAFQAEVIRMTQEMIDWMQPRGPGGFDFLSVRGKPILVDTNVGRITSAYAPKHFVERYAPGAAFVSWKEHPRISADELWDRLMQRGLGFSTDRRRGIFPICWLTNVWAMLVAIGRDRADVLRLEEGARAALV